MLNTIHIVDDDNSILESLGSILESEGYEVIASDSPQKFNSIIKDNEPAVVITDIFFGENEISGDILVKELSEKYPNCQTIVISGESDIEKTISCLKNGALDFIEKPVSLARLITATKNAFNIFNLRSSTLEKSKILGESANIKLVKEKIKKLATLNESILICGENGTGKELVAENLHLYSNNYTHPLYKVNCTALNANLVESELFGHKAGSFTGAQKDKKGFFETASQSSLFIDEIGDFDITLQSKILRVLQEKLITPVGSTEEIKIDTRMIFATHRDLANLILDGSFREDLYFRLSTFTINIPPLRERLEDIQMLSEHFLLEFINKNKLQPKSISEDAINKLKEYQYPGNIRELSKIIKNAAFFSDSDIIKPDDISFSNIDTKKDLFYNTRTMTLTDAKDYMEKEFLKNRMQQMNNDINLCAESLGILKNNLYRKLRNYKIDY